ncbi:MAG: S4 domain-containing protein [bacterium]
MIKVNGKRAKEEYRVKIGDVVQVDDKVQM